MTTQFQVTAAAFSWRHEKGPPTMTTQFQVTAAVELWAKIVGKQIEADLKHKYDAGWRHLGPSLRNDIIHGHILWALLQMDRLSRGDAVAAGELDARVQAVAAHLNPRINPEY